MSVHDNEDALGSLKYKQEQDRILTHATEVYLRYVFRVTDPNLMPPDFREALAWALAADICIAVTQSRTLFNDTDKKALKKIRRAKSADAMEDYPDRMPESDWITARN